MLLTIRSLQVAYSVSPDYTCRLFAQTRNPVREPTAWNPREET